MDKRQGNYPNKDSQESDLRSQNHKAKNSVEISSLHRFYIIIFSVIASFFCVAMPFFTDFGNAVQSQNLYTGLMMSQNHLPYSEIFATGGLLYYAVIALSYFMGSSIWLVFVQFASFYFSGIYLYKIIYHMTSKEEVTINAILLFYLANFALGFGGLYPIQFATPFILLALWFLTKYFAGLTRDEGFIIYGLTGALAYLIEPRTLFFWLVSLAVICVNNMKKRRFAHGFYQFLCFVFGSLLIFYTLGYFVLNMQILSSYIDQAGAYYFTYFALGKEDILLSILFQLIILFASGLLMGALTFFNHLKQAGDRDDLVKSIVFLSFVFSLIFIILSQSFVTYQFLILLPFGLILTSLFLDDKYSDSLKRRSRRRQNRRLSRRVFDLFLLSHFYLPCLLLLYGLAQPIVHYIGSYSMNQERAHIVNYIRENTKENAVIYTWDTSAKIYMDSDRRSSALFPLPMVNTVKASNQKALEDELLQNEASYVVVNEDSEHLSPTLKKDIVKKYKKVSLKNSPHFAVYKLN
ncbi:membrane protein [Streptococcus macacae NCTC 11558]|uniref:Membrane protein n=1 Tax=Streptococcus macacae NCTC 11558 TaxID=764298 RepID=G5JWY6_9STRE|nr:putative membrane protein [Streptococcus macacae NCTC 11558]SUN79463.1 membrane protein [Streptococcus macacae NCTC 11558]